MSETKERLNQNQELPKRPEMLKDVKPETGPVPREIRRWIDKIEENPTGNLTLVKDDKTGATGMTPSTTVNPTIILPTTKKTFTAGFVKKISDAGRWLSVFILRLIKIKKGRVKFKEE